MHTSSPTVTMTGREELTYRAGGLSVRMQCYYRPENREYTVVLHDRGTDEGSPRQLTPAEVVTIEGMVRLHLGARRLFGIRFGTNAVNIVRGQALES